MSRERRVRRRLGRRFVDALHLDVERNLVFRLDDLRKGDEAVDELLSKHLLDNVLVIIVAQSTAQLVVVHVVLVLSQAPEPRHLFGVDQLELSVVVGPRDHVAVLVTQEQLQQELPQRDVCLHTKSCL